MRQLRIDFGEWILLLFLAELAVDWFELLAIFVLVFFSRLLILFTNTSIKC